MVAMQHLVKLPEISATMREMSKEMMKAGILEEMIDETMESLEDTEEIEEEAQSEIDRVLWELTAGKLGVCTFLLCCLKKLDIILIQLLKEAPLPPQASVSVPTPIATETNEDEERDMDEMQSRLEQLRS